jgi:GNAT superfamily N-acetyltransferase
MDTIIIRPAARDDLDTLAILSEQLGYPVAPAVLAPRLESVLTKPGHSLLVAEDGGKVMGWVHGVMRYLLEEEPHAFIGGLIVADGQRSRGVGAKLMAAIEGWARGEGAREVHVYSNVVRERAHRFYERIGYNQVKTSKVFKKSLV